MATGEKIKIIDIRNLSEKNQSGLDKFLDVPANSATTSSRKQIKVVEESDHESESKSEINMEGGAQSSDSEEIAYESSAASDDDADDADDDDESVGSEQDGGAASEASTSSTIEMLSSDPLFLVLSEYLVNKKGENIVTVLDKINRNLSALVQVLKEKK
jgi:nitric oxide reductase activation protein